MSSISWTPTTFEDRLLYKYLNENPGKLFLEVRVGGSEDILNARRIDGVLVPGSKSEVYSPGKYTIQDLKKSLDGSEIHIIEAKGILNRNVIGQVLVGSSLLARKFNPSQIRKVALCSAGEMDLEWFCNPNGVEVAFHPIIVKSSTTNDSEKNRSINDIRKDLNEYRRKESSSLQCA